MPRKLTLAPADVTRYLPQFFIGLFFLTAAYLKWSQGLFGEHRTGLDAIFRHWLEQGLAVPGYRELMTFVLPYADLLAGVVIALQAVAGLLLILNVRTRTAGALIFLLHLNIYLATYNLPELRVLGSQALWIGIYFFARPYMKGGLWNAMTLLVVLLGLIHLYGRHTYFGDTSAVTAIWQREYFSLYVMSSWPGLKGFVLWVTESPAGMLLWAGGFWIKLALLLLMLTKYRLQAGAALLVFVLLTTLIWLNAWTCEGVFWALFLFLWAMHERDLQRSSPPTSLFT